MQPLVIDVQNAEDWRDVVHRAVQTLAEGGLVVFPTETVYGLAASALDERAVSRMIEVKSRTGGNKPLTLAIKSAEEALDYAPDLCPLAQRLARRCWPGPITLVVDDSHPQSLVRRLPEKVRQAVSPANAIGLRVPGHQIILDVMRMLAGPLDADQRESRRQAGSGHRRGSPRKPGRGGRSGARRRPLPFRPAVVGRSRAGQAAGNPPPRRRARADAASAFEHDDFVRLHGQHLPQPDGRGDLPRSVGEEDRLRKRRLGRPRRAGDVGGHRGDDGRPGEPRIGLCHGTERLGFDESRDPAADRAVGSPCGRDFHDDPFASRGDFGPMAGGGPAREIALPRRLGYLSIPSAARWNVTNNAPSNCARKLPNA